MPSDADEKALDTQDPRYHQSSLSPQPQQPTLSQMTIHVYPTTQQSESLIKSKRHQVKNACTNCRKVCKKCDDARPCYRCVKYGISEACVDSQRKRRRGGKRGPYKRGKGKIDQDDTQREELVQLASAAPAIQSSHAEPWNIPGCCAPYDYPQYPQGFYMYNHYPPTTASQQAESVHHVCMPVTQPHFLASVPQFQPYVYPVHGPKYHASPPEAYYTAVFSSISYPENGQLIEDSGMIAHDQL